ncbi:10284_t:CDS:2, partial [Paraglomus brasilianum]
MCFQAYGGVMTLQPTTGRGGEDKVEWQLGRDRISVIPYKLYPDRVVDLR